MSEPEQDLVERVLEDEGLVAGLCDEAAEVVRAWCLARIHAATEEYGADYAARYADELVATARVVTEVVNELCAGVPRATVAARLGRVVKDGSAALDRLDQPGPLPDRIEAVLATTREPRVAR